MNRIHPSRSHWVFLPIDKWPCRHRKQLEWQLSNLCSTAITVKSHQPFCPLDKKLEGRKWNDKAKVMAEGLCISTIFYLSSQMKTNTNTFTRCLIRDWTEKQAGDWAITIDMGLTHSHLCKCPWPELTPQIKSPTVSATSPSMSVLHFIFVQQSVTSH